MSYFPPRTIFQLGTQTASGAALAALRQGPITSSVSHINAAPPDTQWPVFGKVIERITFSLFTTVGALVLGPDNYDMNDVAAGGAIALPTAGVSSGIVTPPAGTKLATGLLTPRLTLTGGGNFTAAITVQIIVWCRG